MIKKLQALLKIISKEFLAYNYCIYTHFLTYNFPHFTEKKLDMGKITQKYPRAQMLNGLYTNVIEVDQGLLQSSGALNFFKNTPLS